MLLLAAGAVSSAAPLCTSGYLDVYLNLPDGCTIGDKWFSNFTFLSTGDQAPTAGQVWVSVDATEPLGLAFSSTRWNIDGNNKTQTTVITYLVTVYTGPDLIVGATASAGDITATGPTTGTVTLTKSLCPGAAPGCTDPILLSAVFTSNTAAWFASASWDPVSQVGVTDQVVLWTGSGAGQKRAGLGGAFAHEFARIAGDPPMVVPEPHSCVLFALGLSACALLRRFRSI